MHDYDREEILAIANEAGIGRESLWADYHSTPSFMRMLDSLDLVVGERLHAAILATGRGIPTISVGYRPKCAHYMESIDASAFCTSTESVTVDWLLERTDTITADYEGIARHLADATNRLRSAQRDFAKRLIDCVDHAR